ncbi:kinase [Pseudoxanthomonas sp.]|uniref:kinase n=1 Tax=Pseudoxanthomonas sp. TaxID=1871049 RepID=UPI00261EA620|nr:kinase [Pseudoxanthomonas sp.]WDS37641.1 MAG: kinase [Pseudoxanthomonas sp.]
MGTPTHPSGQGFPDTLVQAALASIRALPQAVPVWGLSMLQGTGKSTFAAQLARAATDAGLRPAVLSLDDFYLTRAARKTLAHEVHPLLETRGPPGTHDLPLALATLRALREGRSVKLPRFDKLADDRAPESQWPTLEAPAQLVIFEGWCLGTPAQELAALVAPINALEREEDRDGLWRSTCNAALARDYPALWKTCDALWFLQPPGFDNVVAWRWQAEQQLKAAHPGQAGMTRAQLERFVQHYERVSRQALRTLPRLADRVIAVDAQRRVVGH